jgi:hypothetical protein
MKLPAAAFNKVPINAAAINKVAGRVRAVNRNFFFDKFKFILCNERFSETYCQYCEPATGGHAGR